MKKAKETVLCDYYTKNGTELMREYGEVKLDDLEEIKGYDLPVHKKLSKMLKK